MTRARRPGSPVKLSDTIPNRKEAIAVPDPAKSFLTGTNAKVVDRIDLPARPERRLPTPEPFRTETMTRWLESMTGSFDTLWRHQSLALEQIAVGVHVVVATGTASGKSLVFQAPLIREILSGPGRALVLCPQKALAGDQVARFQRALQRAGLDPSLVGEINGDIPMQERERVLERARVVLATPDVIHCWLMPQVASPAGQAFFADLRYVVIDEAHAYEGVFGSTSAFFFRRLHCAAARYSKRSEPPFQYIAATATISNPAQHLANLTGCEFQAIGEEENGAPFPGLTLLHVEGPDHGAPAEKMLADTVTNLAGSIAPNALIAFADSRQGVEKITRAVASDEILPYRSGYELADSRKIVAGLHAGSLRGVVSTSALELGIDIPQFTVGLNLGVPQNRKAFRQRIGRIGRSTPGVFAVIAPASAFAQLGITFRDFYEGEVEQSHLYLDNRYVQFQQARCLVQEIAAEDGQFVLPAAAAWPAGFDRMFVAALPGAVRSRDLEAIAAIGAESPHFAYPLRRIGDVTYALRLARGTTDKIGTIDIEKAMKEAYPGATYYHLKRPYRVTEWRTRSHEHLIFLEPIRGGAPTRPMLRTLVNFSQEWDGVIEGRHLASDAGSLSEVALGVHESVEGYTIGATSVPYREACQKDSRLSRKQREFLSSGVVLRIDAPWFKGAAEHQIAARRSLAHALKTLLSRIESIAPGDIRCVHTGVALLTPAGPRKIDDAIVLFDTAQGGLRLTAPLFDCLPRYLEQLSKGACLAGEEALLDASTVDRLLDWFSKLESADPSRAVQDFVGDRELLVFAPESEVALKLRGTLIHRKLLEPQLIAVDDEERLMYRYESAPGVLALIAHERCEPIGQNWRKVLWNPDSNVLREIEA